MGRSIIVTNDGRGGPSHVDAKMRLTLQKFFAASGQASNSPSASFLRRIVLGRSLYACCVSSAVRFLFIQSHGSAVPMSVTLGFRRTDVAFAYRTISSANLSTAWIDVTEL